MAQQVCPESIDILQPGLRVYQRAVSREVEQGYPAGIRVARGKLQTLGSVDISDPDNQGRGLKATDRPVQIPPELRANGTGGVVHLHNRGDALPD